MVESGGHRTVTRRVRKSLLAALALAALIGVLAVSTCVTAAGTWPRCISGCTANDVEVRSAWLENVTGCTPGQPVTADLWLKLYFHRQNTYCILIVADIFANGVRVTQDWISPNIAENHTSGEINFPMGKISWTCGSRLELSNILVMWQTNASSCPANCSEYNAPSKCNGTTSPIVISAPLVADFVANPTSGCAPLAVQFTDLTTGGLTTQPYAYDWDFGDATAHSTDKNPLHTYFQPGSYTVKLTVTDGNSTVDSETKTAYVVVSNYCGTDLALTMTESLDPVNVGQVLVYTLTVTNSGGYPAAGVSLTDTLPLNLLNASYSTDGGGTWLPYASGNSIALGTLPAGVSTVALIRGTPSCAAVGTILNAAQVSSTTSETNPANNQASVSTLVVDSEKPTIACPPAVTVNNTPGVCGASNVQLGTPTAGDNCGVASVTNNAPSVFPVGTTTVTWTVTDIHGNTATCTQLVTVVDNEKPTITCPVAVTVSNDAGKCSASGVQLGTPGTSDNCGVASVTNNRPSVFPVGATTVTWTVTDIHGNTAMCTQLVTVNDTEKPTITCPVAVTVNNDAGKCSASGVQLGTPGTSDNCGVASVTNNGPSVFPVGATTVTWTVTDIHGNTATCSQSVTVVDTEKPTITCPAPVTVNNDAGKCSASGVQLGTPTTSDNCGVASVTSNAPSVFPVGTTTVTWTVTDIHGNTATCTQLATVNDTEKPTITCPPAVTVSNDIGKCTASGVSLGAPVTGDNCGVLSVTNNAPSAFPFGPTTVTWTVTDIHGNTATCTQLVTVNDTEKPTITCPPAVTVNNDSGKCSASGVLLGTPTTGDNCGVQSVTNNAPTVFPVGTTTVTWTVTDIHGNIATCTQLVTVNDTEKPTITCAPAVTVSNDIGKCTASGVSLGTPVAGDNCGVLSVTSNAPSVFPVGTTTVTWTVTDIHGNTATCTQLVTVNDSEKPTITCPAPVTVNNDAGKCSASGVSLGTPVTSDNCGVQSTTNNGPSVFPVGTTTVTWTVTDIHGNTATCSQSVTVVDTEKPTITCPAPVTVNNDAGKCSASGVQLGTPSTSDNCGVALVTSNAPSVFPVGTTTVTWTVTDIHGNTATCTQLVTVNDTEKPTIGCPSAVTVNNDAGKCSASGVSLATPVTGDNCGVLSVTNNAPSVFPVGTTSVTWTVTDIHGNTATCTQLVTVNDTEKPVAHCPSDIAVNGDVGKCSASVTFAASPADNCGVASAVYKIGTSVITSPHVFPVGETTVDVTVVDIHGNSANCSFKVTVADAERPTIACPPAVTVSRCGAGNVQLGVPTTSDNCGVQSATNDAPSVFPLGITTVTWTVTDIHGNTATCTQNVTVLDSGLPSIACPPAVTVNNAPGECGARNVALGTPTTSAECGAVSIANDAPLFFPVGTTTVTWTATDIYGQSATCTQLVTVVDNEKPTITCPIAVTVNNDAGKCSASGVQLGTPGTSDNCGVQSVTNDGPSVSPVGTATVTWTVTDIHGNTATCTQLVTVVDNEKPTISCPPAVTVNNDAGKCSASGVQLGTPTTGDNCGVASVTSNAPSVFPVGTTSVTWTVTDIHGNTATCSQNVTVVDNEKPTISCPPAVTVNNDAGKCSASEVLLGTPTTGDNCGVASVTSNAPSVFPVGTTSVTWTVTDIHGNTATCTQLVTVNDNEKPTISCPPAMTVSNDVGKCSASGVQLGMPTTGDNCGVQSVTNNTPSIFPVGTTTVIWTVTDIHGNTATCTQLVTVNDTEEPTITCPPTVTVSNTPGVCGASGVQLGTPTTSDNCGVQSVANDAPTTFPVGTTTVMWMVTDIHGNTATCSQNVTVVDNEKPTISCPPAVTVNNDAGKCSASEVLLGTPTTGDNCGVASVTSNAPSVFPVGTTSVTWTVTDIHGNTATCTQLVTVNDNEKPTIACPNDISQDHDPAACNAYVAIPVPPTSDNCGVESVISDYTGTGNASGTYPIGTTLVTWTATDIHGNSTQCSFHVTVTDADRSCGNHPPVAVDDTKATPSNTPVDVPVLANDSDPDGDPLTIISFTNSAHGTVTQNPDGTMHYVPAPGYTGTDSFTYTISDGRTGTATAVVTIDVRPTLVAVVSPPGGGTVTPAGTTTYGMGTVVPVSATANPGYRFDHWEGDLGGSTNPQSVTMTGDKTVTAVFMKTYTLTAEVSPAGGGTVAPAGTTTYDMGTVVPVSATANPGYRFDHWEGDLGGSTNPQSVTMTGDKTVTAVFVKTYTLTTEVFPLGGGTVSPVGTTTYDAGTVVSVLATPAPGWHLAGWSGDATGTTNPVDVTMNADKHITATFVPNAYTITASAGPNGSIGPSGDVVVTYGADQGFTIISAPHYHVADVVVDGASAGPLTGYSFTNVTADHTIHATFAIDRETLTTSVVGSGSVSPASGMYDYGTVVPITATPDPGYRFDHWEGDLGGSTNPQSVTMTSDKSVTAVFVKTYTLTAEVSPAGGGTVAPAGTTTYDAGTLVPVSATANPGHRFDHWEGDLGGSTNPQSVTMTSDKLVTAVFVRLPRAVNDQSTVTQDGIVTITVLRNDDLGEPLTTIVGTTTPQHGSIRVNPDGTIDYTPDPSYMGLDGFQYTIQDAYGDTSTATVTVQVTPKRADLAVSKSVDSATPVEGETVRFTITVTNSGPDAATRVAVSDLLPAGLTYVSDDGNGAYVAGVWDVGSVGVGAIASLHIRATVGPGTTGTTITNRAAVARLDQEDPDPTNDSATVDITIAGPPGGGGGSLGECDGKVIISEVAWAGTGVDPQDQWIELRNVGNAAVDLDGWTLQWRRKHPVTPEEYEWKVIPLKGTLAGAGTSACDLALESGATPSLSVEKRSSDPFSWLVQGKVCETGDSSYYLLERISDSTVRNVAANLVYDAKPPYVFDLSLQGDVIQLLNEGGEIVDTANTDKPDQDGWLAGNAGTFGTMERTDPLGPDTAANWHTNWGLVTYGLDAEGHPLVATAGALNSQDPETLPLIEELNPLTTQAGARLEVSLDLTKDTRKATGWPWIQVVQRQLAAAAGGGGAAEAQPSYSFSSRYAQNAYWVSIDTAALPSGRYDFWIVYGPNRAVLVPVDVVHP